MRYNDLFRFPSWSHLNTWSISKVKNPPSFRSLLPLSRSTFRRSDRPKCLRVCDCVWFLKILLDRAKSGTLVINQAELGFLALYKQAPCLILLPFIEPLLHINNNKPFEHALIMSNRLPHTQLPQRADYPTSSDSDPENIDLVPTTPGAPRDDLSPSDQAPSQLPTRAPSRDDIPDSVDGGSGLGTIGGRYTVSQNKPAHLLLAVLPSLATSQFWILQRVWSINKIILWY